MFFSGFECLIAPNRDKWTQYPSDLVDCMYIEIGHCQRRNNDKTQQREETSESGRQSQHGVSTEATRIRTNLAKRLHCH